MEKHIKNLWIYMALALVVGLFIGGAFSFGKISASENVPGTAGDPLVSKSYVDTQLSNKIAELEATIAQLEGQPVTDTQQGDTPEEVILSDNPSMAPFEVLKLTQGQQLILGESTELILRSGSATAIATVFGNGLTDITAGIDVGQDEIVEWNHLLLAPRPDGRGITIQSEEAYVMVRGSYEIY